jgi:hypothetical protein
MMSDKQQQLGVSNMVSVSELVCKMHVRAIVSLINVGVIYSTQMGGKSRQDVNCIAYLP